MQVEGQTRYPNDFSTATLKPLPDAAMVKRSRMPFAEPPADGPSGTRARAPALKPILLRRLRRGSGTLPQSRNPEASVQRRGHLRDPALESLGVHRI